jgi:hypothetical protein
MLSLSACAKTTATKAISSDEVVKAFKDAGLEAEAARPMTKEDYGIAPMRAKEGKRFYIPSIGKDKGGRILVFDNSTVLEQTKKYYDEMGKQSAMFFSWTVAKGMVLVQITGDLKEAQFNKYKAVVESLK